MDTDAVLNAARQIDGELTYLLGPESDTVALKLRDALASGSDDATAVRVMMVLGGYESTREWMAAQTRLLISKRGYQPLGGEPMAPPPPRPLFVCAEPGCGSTWLRGLGVGEPIPFCHGKQLVPKR